MGAPDDSPPIEDVLGIQFDDPGLLTQALTHRSFVNESDSGVDERDNERLEFLGDAVLDLIVADLLYRRYPHADEGELTQLRAAIVKTESLAQLGSNCRLGEYLRIGHGEELSGGRQRATLLCQAFEALVGAIYLDRGLPALLNFVTPPLLGLLDHIVENRLHIDARSQLQERVQARLNIPPDYRVTGAAGPEHAKEFRVEVAIGDVILGAGIGASKRAAARDAARVALQQLEADGLPDSVLQSREGAGDEFG
ncbi:MAG: ribonuclease III [Chloroflexi bacterium]|nr:ribonuclease III [Chloroflexota bacterium]